jgi:hypothetical protein
MAEKREHDGIKTEIERGHFVRAALIAEHIGLPEKEIRNLRFKAIERMSAVYRNAHGTKRLARQYGFSRENVKEILENFIHETKKEGNSRILGPRYDYTTGRYVSFEEWRDYYLKIWDRLPG